MSMADRQASNCAAQRRPFPRENVQSHREHTMHVLHRLDIAAKQEAANACDRHIIADPSHSLGVPTAMEDQVTHIVVWVAQSRSHPPSHSQTVLGQMTASRVVIRERSCVVPGVDLVGWRWDLSSAYARFGLSSLPRSRLKPPIKAITDRAADDTAQQLLLFKWLAIAGLTQMVMGYTRACCPLEPECHGLLFECGRSFVCCICRGQRRPCAPCQPERHPDQWSIEFPLLSTNLELQTVCATLDQMAVEETSRHLAQLFRNPVNDDMPPVLVARPRPSHSSPEAALHRPRLRQCHPLGGTFPATAADCSRYGAERWRQVKQHRLWQDQPPIALGRRMHRHNQHKKNGRRALGPRHERR